MKMMKTSTRDGPTSRWTGLDSDRKSVPATVLYLSVYLVYLVLPWRPAAGGRCWSLIGRHSTRPERRATADSLRTGWCWCSPRRAHWAGGRGQGSEGAGPSLALTWWAGWTWRCRAGSGWRCVDSEAPPGGAGCLRPAGGLGPGPGPETGALGEPQDLVHTHTQMHTHKHTPRL